MFVDHSEVSLRRIRDNLIIFLLFALLMLAGFYQIMRKSPSERAFSLIVKITYENREPQTLWNLTESDMMLGLFMNNSWQTVFLRMVSHPIRGFIHDSDGNKIVILNVTRESLKPSEKISLNATYWLISKERRLPSISEDKSGTLNDIPKDLKEEYCKPTRLWGINTSLLEEKAQEIRGGEIRVLSIVREFVRWIASNIKYSSSEVPRYPHETFTTFTGDCDDQANLLIAFCRTVGIPAYLQVGCVYIERYNQSRMYWSGHLLIRQIRVGWHGWAMVYIPPWGWLPVDLTYVEGDLRREPLNAILFSAIVRHYVFQYMNITSTDYIAESRALKEFLEAREFYIHEEDEMKEIRIEETLSMKTVMLATAPSSRTSFISHLSTRIFHFICEWFIW